MDIPAGQTDGLYITRDDGGWLNYTNGSNTYSNGQIQLTLGIGNAYPFGTTFSPRTWNGTIYYIYSSSSAHITLNPSSLTVTRQLGTSLTVPLTISNTGSGQATFELRESNGGFTSASSSAKGHGVWQYHADIGIPMKSNQGGTASAYPSAYRWTPDTSSSVNVLVYADDWVHAAPNTYLDQALQALGIAYTAHYDGDFSGFEFDLAGGTWDEVLYEGDAYSTPSTTLVALKTYVQGGGKLGAEICDMLNNNSDPLYAALGVAYVNNYTDPTLATYWWSPANPIFTNPDSAPEWPSNSCPAYWSCGQYVNQIVGVSTALAGYTSTPASGQGALILGGNGNTVFKAFLDAANTDTDNDSDGIKDAVELWTNIAHSMLYSDIPWLSKSTLAGTIPPW